MWEVSLRLLSYFTVIAEELHITRAAERLHIAQPALSKAVRRLEREMGFPLLVRHRSGVALTPAGQELLVTARRLVGEFEQGVVRAQRAHRGEHRVLRVGYHSSIGPELMNLVVDGFGAVRPGWHLEFRLADWTDPTACVLSGACDLALLFVPVAGQELLDVEPLRRDRRWVALSENHRLADRTEVSLADLRDEAFVALPASTGPLRDFWLATGEFGERPAIAVEVTNAEDMFEAVSAGQGIALLTETSTTVYRRPGIVYHPVVDASPGELVIAWPRGSADPVLRDFVAVALSAARTADPS